MQSCDVNRMDQKKTSSPLELDALFPVTNDTSFRVDWPRFGEGGGHPSIVAEMCLNELDDAARVKATTSAILNWKSETLVDITAKYARLPSDRDSEVKADQPILQAVICRIIEILANSKNSEVMHGVTTEQFFVGSNVGNTKDRRIDITVSHREEYLALVLPTMVKKAIEIRTARDEDGEFKKALEKGRSQIVNHLGRRLLYALDFGGAGKDRLAIGVSLTHLSIEVIKMTLTGLERKRFRWTCAQRAVYRSLVNQFGSMDTNGILLLAGALKHRTPQ
jgi:hypothetical protein